MHPSSFFRPILSEAFFMTWKHKAWWIVGFFALILSTSFGMQLVTQGISAFSQPEGWIGNWQLFAEYLSPGTFLKGQWQLLSSEPKAWFATVLGFSAIGLVLLAGFALSAYSIAAIIAAAKLRALDGRDHFFAAFVEAAYHFKSVFWLMVLFQVVINVLLVLFSLPVIWLGSQDVSGLSLAVLLFFFLAFLAVGFTVTMVTLFALMRIVVEDYALAPAIITGWRLFKQHWFLTLEMFVVQGFLTIIISGLLLLLISVIVIPIVIIGLILISYQFTDITVYIPKLTIYGLLLVATIVGSAFTMFNLLSWANLFIRIEKVRPHSRFAQYISVNLLS